MAYTLHNHATYVSKLKKTSEWLTFDSCKLPLSSLSAPTKLCTPPAHVVGSKKKHSQIRLCDKCTPRVFFGTSLEKVASHAYFLWTFIHNPEHGRHNLPCFSWSRNFLLQSILVRVHLEYPNMMLNQESLINSCTVINPKVTTIDVFLAQSKPWLPKRSFSI